jgi:type II secretory pathway component PulJ
MDLVIGAVNGALIAAVGLLLGWAGKGRFDALENRMDALERRMDRIEDAIQAMRSDLTQVALAVGARRAADNQ